jgi:hypothetical protein
MPRIRTQYVALFLVAAAAAVPVACGGDKKPAETPPLTTASPPPTAATAAATPDAGPTAAPDAGAPTPLSTILTTDPNVLNPLLQAAQNAAAALMQNPGAVPNDPIEAGLKANAAAHAKGLKAEGQIAKADLKEGDHASMMVTLQAGYCYAIVGFSPKGAVQDLDLRLLAPPFYNLLSGEDTSDDNTPVVGKDPAPMCPLISSPLPYKVDIHAQKGGGKVGAQLYSKPAK